MDVLRSYESLTASSSRSEVSNVLRSIMNGSLLLSSTDRDRLVVLLLQDVEASLDRSDKKARLTRKDAGLALLALKTLGRAAAASQIISRESNLRILLSATKSLRSSDSDAADDALRRILFLSTASSASSLFQHFFGRPSISFSQRIMEKNNHQDIVAIISKQLDFLLNGILLAVPMSREAMIDLLKLTFNILCHWPKIAPDAEEVRLKNGNDEAGSSSDVKPVLGERWTRRLDGFLPALRRVFLSLPPMSPSPLAPPVTHVLHSLLPIPVDDKLYLTWFPEEGTSSGHSTPRSTNSSPTTSEPHPRASTSSDSPTSGSATSKSKEREGGGSGAFDRALHMLTPRLSLSRSPSPVSSVAKDLPEPLINAPPGVPKVIQRSMDLLDVTMAHYLPGNIDPDDASVKKACKDEDVELDHVLSPLVLLMTKLCKHNVECRKAVRQHMLPPDLDRTSPLEGRSDTLGRCIRLMACVNHQQLKDAVGELIFVDNLIEFVSAFTATIMSSQIGYGNAAGYLFNRGILSAPPPALTTKSGAAEVVDPSINPITGMVQQEAPPGPEMTEEEKEREAERLFVLFERLERAGGMENPIKKALHEGRLEKYSEQARKRVEGDSD
ncbi:hypothetical protein A7U60_g4532 [Sanghuangporus baumii]|uniref:Synembryn-A n=1 Tax=Sanghuangporus baumii TaxID=108892 RepID=A0A9Q5HYF6_SANBA|nr:hypothetical protein A7U60_g4532 [Sanghuangporus baumii]